MNYWCNYCYQKIQNHLNETYGNDWKFSNLQNLVVLSSENKNESASIIFIPPLIQVDVPFKLQKGGYSKTKREKIFISNYTFCPFCGKKIEIKEAKKGEFKWLNN